MTIFGAGEPTMVRVSPAQRQGRRSNDLICQINVMGFASVMFVLLAIFVFPALTVIDYHGATADLPHVGHPIPMRGANREDALTVVVQRDGKVYWGHDPILLEDLPIRIREGVNRGAEKKVYIQADARANYRDVKEVLDRIREAGVQKIAFLAWERRAAASARSTHKQEVFEGEGRFRPCYNQHSPEVSPSRLSCDFLRERTRRS